MRRISLVLLPALFIGLSADVHGATCMNRFLARKEQSRQIVTLLTGKLTFQEAQALSKAIVAGEAPPVEWVDEKGKLFAKQYGEMKVVRPMPVGCDGKPSGVVIIVTFLSFKAPVEKMYVKLNPTTTVVFDEQKTAE